MQFDCFPTIYEAQAIQRYQQQQDSLQQQGRSSGAIEKLLQPKPLVIGCVGIFVLILLAYIIINCVTSKANFLDMFGVIGRSFTTGLPWAFLGVIAIIGMAIGAKVFLRKKQREQEKAQWQQWEDLEQQLDEEIEQYGKDYRKACHINTVKFFLSPFPQELFEWQGISFLEAIKALDRNNQVKDLQIAQTWHFYANRIECDGSDDIFDFYAHRISPFEDVMNIEALATAWAFYYKLALVQQLGQDPSGTPITIILQQKRVPITLESKDNSPSKDDEESKETTAEETPIDEAVNKENDETNHTEEKTTEEPSAQPPTPAAPVIKENSISLVVIYQAANGNYQELRKFVD